MGSEAASTGRNTTVRSVVHAVVAATAPAELPVVEGLLLSDDATVVRRLRRRKSRQDPLGFGLGEVAVLVTPVVWLVLDQTARQFTDIATQSMLARLRALCARVLRRRSQPVVVPALSPEQLDEVHRRVKESAGRHGLDARRAASVADSVVARLVLARREDPPADDIGTADPDA